MCHPGVQEERDGTKEIPLRDKVPEGVERKKTNFVYLVAPPPSGTLNVNRRKPILLSK